MVTHHFLDPIKQIIYESKHTSDGCPKGVERIPPWIFQQTFVRARNVYYGGSRTEAIKAHCIDCVGSLPEVRKCETYSCPLWPHRPGRKKGEVPPGVPSLETLERLALENPDTLKKIQSLKAARGETPSAPSTTKKKSTTAKKKVPRQRL